MSCRLYLKESKQLTGADAMKSQPREYVIVGRCYGDSKITYYNKDIGFCNYLGEFTFVFNTDLSSATRLSAEEVNKIFEEILKGKYKPQGRNFIYQFGVQKIKEEPMQNNPKSSYSVEDEYKTIVSNSTHDIKLAEAFAKLQSLETENSNPKLLYVMRDGRFIESIYRNGIKFIREVQ